MRRNLPGAFQSRNLEGGAWRLSRRQQGPIDVFLTGAAPAECFRAHEVRDVDIEWRTDAVCLTVTADGRPETIRTQSAIVHEPLPQLYAALPLAVFDERARRFWRRVFRLVRIPGGRHLLGFLARRSRAPR